MESGGGNLVKGLENLLDDLERGKGELKVSMTDREAFELGKNVATTPGKVVFQNELMQLIQYAPSTKQVDRRPLLIIPPWINKFYILDLQPKNSFIKFCVDQGKTVFVISWVNPDERHRDLGWDDYMTLGPLAALDAIEQATGERRGQRHRLLHRRHAAGDHAGLHGGHGRPPDRLGHLLHLASWTSRRRAS